MKKALVLALTVLMVLSLATAAFAVEVEYSGKVGVKWSNEAVDGAEGKVDGFAKDSLEAKVVLDFTEDYGDGVTAGVKTKVEAHEDQTFVFDGGGWVQLERDLFTAKASTDIDGGVGKDLGEFGIAGAPGLGLDLNLIDGLTVNTIINAGSDYNYLVKGEYADDLFSIGGGYQVSIKEFVDEDDVVLGNFNTSAIGVYGSVNPIEGLAINAEFGSRNLNTDDDDTDAATAILASAAYDLDALSAKAGLFIKSARFGAVTDADDLDEEEWRINEALRVLPAFLLAEKASDTVVFADASYQISDDFAVNGWFDYLVGSKDTAGEAVEFDDDVDRVSYKVGAAYTLGDLTLDAYYKAWVDSKVGGKATYALADGVKASFEAGYLMPKDEDLDANLVYTAKVVAEF